MKKEPMIKVLKGGDNFKMIDSKMDSSDRPALTTEAQNTQLIRTTLSSQNNIDQTYDRSEDKIGGNKIFTSNYLRNFFKYKKNIVTIFL